MSKQAIGVGSAADDDTGDTLRAGGVKINANFDEIYSFIGDGTDLLAASARASLGLGTAATTASSDYATAAQGATADTAVQPARAVNTGTGLDGGGDLSADRTLALDAAALTSLDRADTATQPGDLATVATSGAYSDLSGTPTIPTTALPVGVVTVTASKTLALTDANTEQVVNAAGAVVLTIPTNAAVALPVGSKVSALGIGAGTVTVTASAGVTLNGVSAGSVALSAQYSAAVLTKVGTDAWVVNGDRGAVA